MTKKRTFQLQLKNDQVITLEFTSIEVAHNQLWQMFATTEALDMLQQLIEQGNITETSSARKTLPEKSTVNKKKK